MFTRASRDSDSIKTAEQADAFWRQFGYVPEGWSERELRDGGYLLPETRLNSQQHDAR